ARRNSSEHLVMIRVDLLEHGESACCPYEIDASSGRVELDFVRAPHSVQRLNHLSCLGVHDHQFPRFVLVSAFDPASNKNAMMNWIQTRCMGRRTSGDWPLGSDGAFVEVDYL